LCQEKQYERRKQAVRLHKQGKGPELNSDERLNEHMMMLSATPERVKLHFQYKRI